MTEPTYVYRAEVLSVYDGDTITVLADCGFSTFRKVKIRFALIDTPEIRGEEREEGLKSRDYLRELINLKDVIIETERDKTGKYGRYIATVWKDGVNINKKLLIEGYAELY